MTIRPGDPLLADLYELTMAASYHEHGLDQPATFDLFVRSLPGARRFLVAAGLETALEHLETLAFDDDDLTFLAGTGQLGDGFLDRLRDLRFTGEVWAIPEGEVVFGQEPLLRVTAPLVEAQLVETALLNLVAHQTLVASKAARVSLACQGRRFVDFSARRDHGPDAALYGARAAYIGGAAGTSLVAAGRRWDIPLSGTMAHAFVMRFSTEIEAFRAFTETFPHRATLLIDTFDTEEGARRVVRLAAEGVEVGAVRLDSGDLDDLSRSVRRILDDGGLSSVRIFASGDLDEHRIAALVDAGAPIDAYGVGTQLGTSYDAPALGAVYKLAEDVDGPKGKRSTGKETLPGRKQVWRSTDGAGGADHDTIGLADEDLPGRPLLEPVMTDGARTRPAPALDDLQATAAAAVAGLPARLRCLRPDEPFEPYPVHVSPAVRALQEHVGRG